MIKPDVALSFQARWVTWGHISDAVLSMYSAWQKNATLSQHLKNKYNVAFLLSCNILSDTNKSSADERVELAAFVSKSFDADCVFSNMISVYAGALLTLTYWLLWSHPVMYNWHEVETVEPVYQWTASIFGIQ